MREVAKLQVSLKPTKNVNLCNNGSSDTDRKVVIRKLSTSKCKPLSLDKGDIESNGCLGGQLSPNGGYSPIHKPVVPRKPRINHINGTVQVSRSGNVF